MLSIGNWQTYYGPNIFSDDPCCAVSLTGKMDADETRVISACELLHAQWSNYFSGDSWRSLTPEKAMVHTVAEWTLGVLNEVRGFVPGSGCQFPTNSDVNKSMVLWVGFHHPGVTRETIKLAAVIQRIPTSVEGNGKDSIESLIASANRHRSPNMAKSNYHRPIVAEPVVLQYLERNGLTLESVPSAGEKVLLRGNANLSTGGDCIDLTAEVHPEVRQMAEQIAVTLGIDNAGLDYLTTDISASPEDVKGVFVEANITPGLDATIAAGWPPEKIAALVLGDDCGRIPVVLTIADKAAIPEISRHLKSTHSGPGQAMVLRY